MRDRERHGTWNPDAHENFKGSAENKMESNEKERSREFPAVSIRELEELIRQLPEGTVLEVYLS